VDACTPCGDAQSGAKAAVPAISSPAPPAPPCSSTPLRPTPKKIKKKQKQNRANLFGAVRGDDADAAALRLRNDLATQDARATGPKKEPNQ